MPLAGFSECLRKGVSRFDSLRQEADHFLNLVELKRLGLTFPPSPPRGRLHPGQRSDVAFVKEPGVDHLVATPVQ